MTGFPSFICTTCGRSLLLEARIMLDSKDKQYCVKCWARQEKEKVSKLGKKYPTGSAISWVNEDIGKAARRSGTVVKCSDTRIQVKTDDGKYKWIDEDSVLLAPPK